MIHATKRRRSPGGGRPAVPDTDGLVHLGRVRVAPAVAEQLHARAAAWGVTVPEATRRVIEAGITALDAR